MLARTSRRVRRKEGIKGFPTLAAEKLARRVRKIPSLALLIALTPSPRFAVSMESAVSADYSDSQLLAHYDHELAAAGGGAGAIVPYVGGAGGAVVASRGRPGNTRGARAAARAASQSQGQSQSQASLFVPEDEEAEDESQPTQAQRPAKKAKGKAPASRVVKTSTRGRKPMTAQQRLLRDYTAEQNKVYVAQQQEQAAMEALSKVVGSVPGLRELLASIAAASVPVGTPPAEALDRINVVISTMEKWGQYKRAQVARIDTEMRAAQAKAAYDALALAPVAAPAGGLGFLG